MGEDWGSLNKNHLIHMNREENYKNKITTTKNKRCPGQIAPQAWWPSLACSIHVNSRALWCTLVMSVPGELEADPWGLLADQPSLKVGSWRSHQETSISINKVDGTRRDIQGWLLASTGAHRSGCTQQTCDHICTPIQLKKKDGKGKKKSDF